MSDLSDVLSAVVFADGAHRMTTMVKWKSACDLGGFVDPLESDDVGFKSLVTHCRVGGHPALLLRAPAVNWSLSHPDVNAWYTFLKWVHVKERATIVLIVAGGSASDAGEWVQAGGHTGLADFYTEDYFGTTTAPWCAVDEEK